MKKMLWLVLYDVPRPGSGRGSQFSCDFSFERCAGGSGTALRRESGYIYKETRARVSAGFLNA